MATKKERYIYNIDNEEYHYFSGFDPRTNEPTWAKRLSQAKLYPNKGTADEDYETLKIMGFAVIVE